MCGRYSFSMDILELLERYEVEQISFDFTPRYNVAPSQMIPAVIAESGINRIGQLKWGLVPSWAKDEKVGFKMINARSETLLDKPAYKGPFQRKRCIIPADGFFEWKVTKHGKQPMRIMLNDGSIFSMAGLFDTWIADDGRKVHSCSIITTKPNELMVDIHDRMPVILRPEDEHIWLDREKQDVELLQSLLIPYPAKEMRAYPVSTIVGNVRNDSTECIKQI